MVTYIIEVCLPSVYSGDGVSNFDLTLKLVGKILCCDVSELFECLRKLVGGSFVEGAIQGANYLPLLYLSFHLYFIFTNCLFLSFPMAAFHHFVLIVHLYFLFHRSH